MLTTLMLCFQFTAQLPGVTGHCDVHILTSSLLCATAPGYASMYVLNNGLFPAVDGGWALAYECTLRCGILCYLSLLPLEVVRRQLSTVFVAGAR